VIDSLTASLGLYGAALVIGFVAGMFPIVSIELFLVGLTLYGVDVATLAVLIPLGAIGHQVAKTLTYYAGAGEFELPRGRVRDKIAAARAWIERWNKWPRSLMFLAATTGLPPLYLLGFVAEPLMKMRITTFTLITMSGRVLRYVAMVAIARLY
jgi:hypothetical protein